MPRHAILEYGHKSSEIARFEDRDENLFWEDRGYTLYRLPPLLLPILPDTPDSTADRTTKQNRQEPRACDFYICGQTNLPNPSTRLQACSKKTWNWISNGKP